MKYLFAAAAFGNAFLLFIIQPMVAKMILPKFGGAAGVWSTCTFFFQAALLAGYAYAHALTSYVPFRRQALLHGCMIALPLLSLPIIVSPAWVPPGDANPIPYLLGILLVSVGLPFFTLTTSAPMLQKWFSLVYRSSADDAYVLYAASNTGSLLALLCYPVLIEPTFPLRLQSWIWSGGYLLSAGFALCCLVLTARVQPDAEAAPQTAGTSGVADNAKPTRAIRFRWVMLAFAPSSLMLGVTTYLCTDIAPVPLLWIVPLALYLLTYIVAFASPPKGLHTSFLRVFPIAVLVQAFVILLDAEVTAPTSILVGISLITFFVIAMVCHGDLARSRPPARFLTEFYFWLALGGVLGGAFNGLLAPLLFSSLVEFPITLICACLLLPHPTLPGRGPFTILADYWLPAIVGLAAALLLFRFRSFGLLLCVGLPLVVCYAFRSRSTRFGLSLAAVLAAGSYFAFLKSPTLYRERSYYGVLRVDVDVKAHAITLNDGSIIHGSQRISNKQDERLVPLTYYYPTGPAGQVFQAMQNERDMKHIAVVGLGTGSLAAYGKKGQEFHFFELNPAVKRIAEDVFTFLSETPPTCSVVLGDARLSLTREPNGRYSLLVIDAFSGDAIPIHLLTREAVELYLDKLANTGVLLFHISNGHLDLEPVMGALVHDLGLAGRKQTEFEAQIPPRELLLGKQPSCWVVIARKEEYLGSLATNTKWENLSGVPGASWSDDFSNIFRYLKWSAPRREDRPRF